MTKELATLAGGCFWCIEAMLRELKGIHSVVSGYAGDPTPNPTYDDVCAHRTNHAEVVQVEFDHAVLSYEDLISIFLTIHDPTTLNRQGNDIGPQYRSAIFYHSDEQQATAKRVIEHFTEKDVWQHPIVTEISPIDTFYPAESYHQNFYTKNPNQGYCRVVIEPKVVKFRTKYFAQLKK